MSQGHGTPSRDLCLTRPRLLGISLESISHRLIDYDTMNSVVILFETKSCRKLRDYKGLRIFLREHKMASDNELRKNGSDRQLC